MRRMTAVVLAGLVLAVAQAGAEQRTVRGMLAEATVRLASGCTGAVAEKSQIVVTALHCVRDRQSVGVEFSNGEERTAWVVATDDIADQAVLFLEEPVWVTPLRIARLRSVPGSMLYFGGHPDRLGFESARLDRIGVCPSLPDLPNALFTGIHGKPGDSGAPLLNAAGSIAGLVHGGARCEIATPADRLLTLVQMVLAPPPSLDVQRAVLSLTPEKSPT